MLLGCTHMAQAEIKEPRKQVAAWLSRALDTTPKDGQWHKIRDMGPSSAEQTARSLNGTSRVTAGWVFGYRLAFGQDGALSELWVKWV